MTQSKFTIELEKKYGEKLPDKKKSTLSKFFNIPIKYLDEIYDRGRMAGINTGMRKGVTSVDAWGRARMNKFILNVIRAREKEKINFGRGQDSDVILKVLGKNKNTFI